MGRGFQQEAIRGLGNEPAKNEGNGFRADTGKKKVTGMS